MKIISSSKKAAFAGFFPAAALFVLVLFVTGSHCHKVQAQILVKNGMQIYYPFNGSPQDFSGQDNHGMPSAIDYGPDKSGFDSSAAFFNGITGQVTSMFPPSINVNFSLSGWAKIDALPGANQLFSMVGIEENDLYFNAGLSADTTVGFIFKSAGNYQPYSYSTIRTIYTNWFHFCITRQGTVQTQYINGIPTDTQVVASGFVDGTTNSLLIGGSPFVRNFGRGGFFNGFLDEIRLYNRALSRLEIDTLSGLVLLAVKKDWRGLLIGRTGYGKVSFSTSDPVSEISFYDLKGAKLSTNRDVLPNRPYRFDAPERVLIQVLDKKGNRYARFVP